MFEIDLTPLLDVGLQILAGILLAVGTWAVSKIAKKVGIEVDDAARAYVREAIQGGIDYAVKAAKAAGKDVTKIEVKNELVADAVNYVLAQVPDGIRKLNLTQENVENLVRRHLPY